jgi:hypothetical protein
MEQTEQQGQTEQPAQLGQPEPMEQRGYQRYSESKPDQELQAEMANEDGTEYWTGNLAAIQTHGPMPVWWRPARSKDDLWLEVMSMRETSGARIKWHPAHAKES